jgi:hypothetical protein
MAPSELLLVRFAWTAEAPRARIGAVVRRGDIQLFRTLDGNGGYAYVTPPAADATYADEALRAAFPGAGIVRLAQLALLPGASAASDAPYRYVVETDVSRDEDDFNAWYRDEHLPGLASVPGTVRAMRFRSLHGQPRYHACYDLEHPDVLGSSAWLAVRGTPWSDRVRPTFTNTTRTMLRRCGVRLAPVQP